MPASPPHTDSARSNRPNPGDEPSLLERLMQFAWHWRRYVVGGALLATVLFLGISLLLPRKYTSDASFTPQARKLPSNLSGIAAQFGVNVPTGDPSESPQFYANLLTSRVILGDAVRRPLHGPSGATVTLLALYGGGGSDTAQRRDNAIRKARDFVNVAISQQTGVVTLRVTTPHPVLSADLARELLALINGFNLQSRRSRATSERAFLERRSNDIEQSLRQAENRLQSFLQGNRAAQAPGLRFEEERLTRDMRTQAQLYSSVVQAYEQAKLDEVRDTPVITIVENPEVPARPDSRKLAMKMPIALIAGGLLGLFVGAMRDRRRRIRLGYEPADAT